MDRNVIIKRKPSGPIIFLTWLFLIILPVLFLNSTLSMMFSLAEKSNEKLSRNELINEALIFKKDLEIPEYLNREFAAFFAETGNKANLDAEQAARLLQKKTGLKPTLVIEHGNDTASIESRFIDKSAADKLGRLSDFFTLKLLMKINNQPLFPALNPSNQKKLERFQSKAAREKLVADADLFFQRIFGLIAPIPCSPEKTMVSVSSKLGGFVYFYYKPFYKITDKNKSIKSGLFFMIRGRSISSTRVVQSAIKAGKSNLGREVTFFDSELNDDKTLELKKITGFTSAQTGLQLRTTMPQNLMTHIISMGGFYPERLAKVRKRLPLILVTKNRAFLIHPLKKYQQLIYLFEVFFVAIGTLFFLRAFFFGVDLHLGIRAKVSFAILLTLLMPSGLMLTSYVSWQDLNDRAIEIEAENLLQRKLEKIQDKFNLFQEDLQLSSYLLSEKIQQNLTHGKIESLISRNLQNSLAEELYLDFPDRVVSFENPKSNFIPLEKEEDSLRRLFAKGVFNSFKCAEEYKNIDNLEEGIDLFEEKFLVDSTFLSSLIANNGKLGSLEQSKTRNVYSIIPLMNDSTGKNLGCMMLRFNRLEIVKAFLKELKPGLAPEYTEYSFYLRDNEDLQLFNELKLPIPEQRLKIALDTNRSMYWQKTGQKLETFGIKVFPKTPLLVAARQVSVPTEESAIGALKFLVPAFLLAQFIFLAKIIRKIYLQPIQELALAAEKVADQNFEATPEIEDKNEFGDMKKAFDEMVLGVAQKEKLSQFVSKDVIEAVGGVDEQKLKPGGEKVEATILFAALEFFVQQLKENSSKLLLSRLGMFIEAGDKIAEENAGVLDKVIETTLMLVFRAKNLKDDTHALSACRAAIKLKDSMAEMGIETKMALSTGMVISGRIGETHGKLDYTVIGDTVNTAARLKNVHIAEPQTNIIIGPATIRALKGAGRMKFIKRISLKGKSREFPIYELIELREKKE
jgi:class 3 adenylate cyclase/HAMP domain-containing protein